MQNARCLRLTVYMSTIHMTPHKFHSRPLPEMLNFYWQWLLPCLAWKARPWPGMSRSWRKRWIDSKVVESVVVFKLTNPPKQTSTNQQPSRLFSDPGIKTVCATLLTLQFKIVWWNCLGSPMINADLGSLFCRLGRRGCLSPSMSVRIVFSALCTKRLLFLGMHIRSWYILINRATCYLRLNYCVAGFLTSRFFFTFFTYIRPRRSPNAISNVQPFNSQSSREKKY